MDGAFKNSIMQAAELEGTLRLKSVFAIDVKVGAQNIANSHTDFFTFTFKIAVRYNSLNIAN